MENQSCRNLEEDRSSHRGVQMKRGRGRDMLEAQERGHCSWNLMAVGCNGSKIIQCLESLSNLLRLYSHFSEKLMGGRLSKPAL